MTRVAFATLGCRVNQVDTQELQGLLEARGCQTVPFGAAADVVVVNTCAVTARAEFSDRQLIRRAVRGHPNARVVVTGCWAQIDPRAAAAMPGVALVVGASDRQRIGVLIDELTSRQAAGSASARSEPSDDGGCRGDSGLDTGAASGTGCAAGSTTGDSCGAAQGAESPRRLHATNTELVEARVTDAGLTGARAGASMQLAPFARVTGRSRAFLKIQDGCQHRCAFCIVPLARGPSRSRQPEAVVDQVSALVEAGHPEVVLTGVDLGHYGADLIPRTSLAALLRRLDGICGLRWIRLSSVLPAYFTAELIDAVTGLDTIAPHLHVPLQSGSDRVLRQMRRPYNVRLYTRLIERLAEGIPTVGLGTDLITGFPGETDADAAQTESLVAALPFTYLHVFGYSDREGTEAIRLGGHVAPRAITDRSRRLRWLGDRKARAFRQRLCGTAQEALVLETRDRSTGRLTGLTGNYVEVLLDGMDTLKGRLVSVRVTGVQGRAVTGELAG
jgi:threonylcarbamoyladenosine tRNA methylthiotransferase MtaB